MFAHSRSQQQTWKIWIFNNSENDNSRLQTLASFAFMPLQIIILPSSHGQYIYLSTSLLTVNFHSRELYFYSKHIYKHKVKVYQSPLQENCIYLNVDSCQLSTWCPTSNRPPLKVKKHILNCPYCHEKGFIQVSYDTYMIIYALTNFDNLG